MEHNLLFSSLDKVIEEQKNKKKKINRFKYNYSKKLKN